MTICSYHVTYEWIHTLQLPECQGTPCPKQARNLKFKWLQLDPNPVACFEQGVPWNSGNYRMWIHSETRTWHDKSIQSMHRTDKYSQHSSIILPVWLNSWVLVCELSGCGLRSSCSHLNFRFRACFEQAVTWHSGNYRVWIHSETRRRQDKNIQSNALYR